MATLRSPDGCPWDLRQTHESLRSYLIEETYEAVDAIDRGDVNALRGELGDVLLQCVFHAQLATEEGRFTIADVVNDLTAKLVRRHPHVFTAAGKPLSARARRRQAAGTAGAVVEQWARIKSDEQAGSGVTPRLLAGIPRALPALVRAHKIGSRVASVGFDWRTASDVLEKVDEELGELRQAIGAGGNGVVEELGDLLFTLASFARKAGLDPEHVLGAANDKFTARFDQVEAHLAARGLTVHAASQEQLEQAWNAIKASPRPAPPGASSRAGSRSTPPRTARRSRRSPRRPGRS